MNCPKCNAAVNDAALFCMMCGTKIERKPVCKSCGAELGENARFCMMCGTAVENAPAPSNPFATTVNPNATVLYSAKENEYRNRDDLVDVVIADGVTSIAACAFYGCENLASITIPDSVTSIGMGAFCDCENLETVYLSRNAKIHENAFSGCPKVQLIYID